MERQPRERGNYLFFGLALVFGAVGAVSSVGSAPANVSIGGQVEFNTGSSLQSSSKLVTTVSKPLKDGDDFEELTSFEVDPSSTSQNFFTALRLLLQALKTVPVFTYISFALSLFFLVLYLNPFGSLFSGSSASQMVQSKHHRHRRQSHNVSQESTRERRTSSRQSKSANRRLK